MAVVYVHGIGNRPGPRYDSASELRRGLFERFLLPVALPEHRRVRIFEPYWGDYGAEPAWGYASFPAAGGEALGGSDELMDLLPFAIDVSRPDPAAILPCVARGSLRDAVDLLYTAAPDGHTGALLDFAREVVAYCAAHEAQASDTSEDLRYPWLSTVADDLGFVDRLCQEVAGSSQGRESLGGSGRARDELAEGAGALRRAWPARLSTPVAEGLRLLFGNRLTLLVGDVLVYPERRGTAESPGPIIKVVADHLDEAVSGGAFGEPLIVVAHSMGGTIVYDLLSHYRPDLVVDVLVTVGAQVGLMEELKLLRESRADIPSASVPSVPRPTNIRRWINVVDRADLLGFRAAPVFRGVDDYVYPSQAVWAHTAYLRQPNFHARLAERVARALASPPAAS